MQAIILADPDHPEVALLPVAGRPLIARQVEWLRSIGCTSIAVEICSNPTGHELWRWLTDDDALGTMVRLALAREPLAPRALAARAGLSGSEPLLVVQAGVVGAGDPTRGADAPQSGSIPFVLKAPTSLGGALEGSDVTLDLGGLGTGDTIEVPRERAWAVRVRSHDQALALADAALMSRLPSLAADGAQAIEIHAFEREPGVWIARGARVEEGAVLEGPVLIGVDAVVHDGAHVGPSAFVGDRAVVSRGAALVRTVVRPGTIVGEGLRVEGSVIDARGLFDLTTREHVELADPLLAAARDGNAAVSPRSRALAATVLLLSSPLLLAVTAVILVLGRRVARPVHGWDGQGPLALNEGASGVACLDGAVRLFDVVRGARTLIGLRPWTEVRGDGVSAWLHEDGSRGPYGALSIDDALTPPGATSSDRLRARLWYAHAKSMPLDVSLILARLRGARTPPPTSAEPALSPVGR